jgi:hypothetical protein
LRRSIALAATRQNSQLMAPRRGAVCEPRMAMRQ